jgi:hypothetical protein
MKGSHPFIFAKAITIITIPKLEYEGVRPLHLQSAAR